MRGIYFVCLLGFALSACGAFKVPIGSPSSIVGTDRIVVDASGNQIELPNTLPRIAYANEDADDGVPVRRTLWTGPVLSPTPISHPNANIHYTAQAYASFRRGEAIFVYVGNTDDPESRAAIVPGSVWWPTAGSASDPDGPFQRRYLEELSVITGGDRSIPLVFYCDRPGCWAPYNAALRLAGAGYADVAWYRGGTTAWYAAGLPLEIAFAPDWE